MPDAREESAEAAGSAGPRGLGQRWRAMILRGTEEVGDLRQRRRLQSVSTAALAIAATVLLYIPIYALLDQLLLSVINLATGVAFLFIYWLNVRGRFTASRMLTYFAATASITSVAMLTGEGAGVHYMLFLCGAFPFTSCSSSERGLLAYGVALPTLAFFLLEATQYSLLGPPILSDEFAEMMHGGFVLTVFGLLSAIQYSLGAAVDEAASNLERRNAAMRLVLDNVGQGFISVTADGAMAPEHSRVIESWFGAPGERRFAAWIGEHDEDFATWFEIGLEQAASGLLPIEVAVGQLPRGLELGGASYGFDYEVVEADDDALQRLMIIITDTTDARAAKRAAALRAELVEVFYRVLEDRPGFEEFFDETTRLVERALATGDVRRAGAPDVELARALHTVKGNCAVFGVHSVARVCHELEQALLESGSPQLAETQRAALRAAWTEFSSSVQRLLGEQQHALTLRSEELATVLEACERGGEGRRVASLLRATQHESALDRLRRLAEHARRLAARLGRDALNVETRADAVHLPSRIWRRFWLEFTHVLRNAIDHGIEPPEQRRALGKSPQGTLTLEVRVEGESLVIRVADDGAGIDWEKLRERARERQLPAETPAQLLDVLCHDGITTVDRATEVSGRGLGMAAVKQACDALGGRIELRSTRGQGAEFRFVFALERVLDDDCLEYLRYASA